MVGVFWVGIFFFFPHRRALVCGCGKSVISLQFDPTEIQSQQPPASRSDGYHPPSLIICLPARRLGPSRAQVPGRCDGGEVCPTGMQYQTHVGDAC